MKQYLVQGQKKTGRSIELTEVLNKKTSLSYNSIYTQKTQFFKKNSTITIKDIIEEGFCVGHKLLVVNEFGSDIYIVPIILFDNEYKNNYGITMCSFQVLVKNQILAKNTTISFFLHNKTLISMAILKDDEVTFFENNFKENEPRKFDLGATLVQHYSPLMDKQRQEGSKGCLVWLLPFVGFLSWMLT